MRLHELAKKLGFNQQDLLTAVQKQGFDVKNTLMVVDPEVENWVSEQAASGWIPPPPDKKTIKKKKVVLVKTHVPGKTASESEEGEVKPETPKESGEKPESVPAEPEAEAPAEEKRPPETEKTAENVAAETPEIAVAPLPPDGNAVPGEAGSRPDAGIKPDDSEASAVPAAPEPKKPAVVIKRVGTKIRGTAVVGQASPETIAAIKRSTQAKPGRPEKPAAGERGGRPPAAARAKTAMTPNLESVMPDTDLSGKPRVKQRMKTRGKNSDAEDQEALEKKVKVAKRGKDKRQGWRLDDDFGDGSGFDEEDDPRRGEETSNTVIREIIATDHLAPDGDAGSRHAGFKHKRADFKSKRIQHELPASFAEIDNEFTRSLAGGGRRRPGRGGNTVRRNTGRRGRTRRIAGPVQRNPDQAAQVYLGMTLRDLSVVLGVKLQDILGWMLAQGRMVQVNDILSEEDINFVAGHYNIPLDWEATEDLEQQLADEAQHQADAADQDDVVERPPVVTFMGHVDHGKTSLLDCIRNTRVVDGEHGGITQHIGAYSVERNGKRITFLDTPGHEAFSAMRARGANLTDVAVLVVAADDGVMPQTEEAAAHAKNAGVPIVVAINKCDLPSANPDRVRQELANRLGLLPEEWGGRVGMIEVSAISRQGIDDLLERILLESEVLELKANSNRPATGFVVEARMSEGQGVLSTMLVSDGALRAGDVILCSNGYGKIRFMLDEFGKPIDAAGPGTPVRLSGLSAVPEAGDRFFILQDIIKARAIAEQRERETRAAALARRQHVNTDNLLDHLKGSGKHELSVIIKADVVGSLEVLDKTLRDMATQEVGISIIHAAVGGINHADVILADASDALILGFHVGTESLAKAAADNLGVQIKTYHIIYRMIEDMRAALEGLLPPEEKEVVQGHVEIRQVFRASKIGAIAGCYVTDGFIQRASRIRLYRNQIVIYDGTVQSLKRVKDDAREVKAGFECGIKIANYDGIAEGDVIEAYAIEEIARKL